MEQIDKLRIVKLAIDGLAGAELDDFLKEATHENSDSDREDVRFVAELPLRPKAESIARSHILGNNLFRLVEINNAVGTAGYELYGDGAFPPPVVVDIPEKLEITG